MIELFRTILYQPLFNALIFLYETVAVEDLGLAIILLTIAVRIILFPLFHKTAKHQRVAQRIQPDVKKIRDKHKNDREAQTKALMELYQNHKINPLTPFLLLILQLPILFALYRIFINGFGGESFSLLYSFVPMPDAFHQTLFGIVSLDTVSMPLVVITAAAQYFQGRLALAKSPKSDNTPPQMKKVARATVFIGPVIALVILTRFPAALALYWLTSTIFSIIQQVIVNKSIDRKYAGHTGKTK